MEGCVSSCTLSQPSDLIQFGQFYTMQDERLQINEKHHSWSENSTGPLNENTEEVEVFIPNLPIYLYDCW